MRFGLIILAGMLQGACSHQIYTSEEHRAFNLTADDLFEKGIAFTTPTSITGREQDRQSLALTFAEVLREKRPDIHVVSLPETLSAINKAGLLDEYMQMYENYEQTGIFDYSSLKKISAAYRYPLYCAIESIWFRSGRKRPIWYIRVTRAGNQAGQPAGVPANLGYARRHDCLGGL